MNESKSPHAEGRVLFLAPAERDAALCRRILTDAGLPGHCCGDLRCLCRALEEGVDAILLPEEVLAGDDPDCLIQALRRQPPWSDLPVLLLEDQGADSSVVSAAMEFLGNVTVLERSAPMRTLVSALRAAVRARRRQYQFRDHTDTLSHTREPCRSGEGNGGRGLLPLERLFPGDSEMAVRMRAFDWSVSDLGPPERWPENLRMAVSLGLTSRFPILLWWGPNLTVLYNDAYIPFLGEAKHPRSLGLPGREVWGEIWDPIGPMLEGVRATGKATWSDDFLFFFARKLPREEVHVRFTFGPILSADGRTVEGIFCPCTEITEEVVGARRLETLRKLSAKAAEARVVAAAVREAADVLAENLMDIPFAAVYVTDETGTRATLAATAGLPETDHPLPASVSPGTDDSSPWPLAAVLRTRSSQEVDLGARGLRLPGGAWPEPAGTALVLPITAAGPGALAGLLVVGVSPRRVLDPAYRTFFDFVASHIGTALADAKAYEAERRRAEALSELDRAKTAFFSNVSHEFRTPLTLMLGPVEDALQDQAEPLPPGQRQRLETVHRSSLRLLKLVNTLLDFSRIEAGRVQAVYQPTDLARLTAELVSNFRAACEKAGLWLTVDCPPLPEPVYVDRDMWEKIVLNLVSNAFKFTLEGEVAVRLRFVGASAELTVHDTGTGILAEELPRIFERFHRVEGACGRTDEGSGIGLALVQELVKLHGGSVWAASTYGQGSTFVVSIPRGKDHLPADRIGTANTLASTRLGTDPYVEEALRWLPDEETSRSTSDTVGVPSNGLAPRPPHAREASGPDPQRPRVLWADDNADMRDYVRRLLSGCYDVETAPDGEAALAAARAQPPSLVLADVMMPRLDGFGLLRALRADPRTRTTPVILLSARAGEESRVEGLESGADDYLVKPFSGRELQARVAAHLEMARVRRDAGEQVMRAYEEITDGLMVLDREWRYTYLNARAERLAGRPRSTLLGKVVWEEFPALVGTATERQLRKAACERAACEFEGPGAAGDGWYDHRCFSMTDGGVAVYFRDATDRKHAEEEARKLNTALENAVEGIALLDRQGCYLSANPAYSRIAGYRPDELVGSSWQPSVHPDDLEQVLAAYQVMLREGRADLEVRGVRQDRTLFWKQLVMVKAHGQDRRWSGHFCFMKDITERKRVEEALRQSESRLRRVVESNMIGILLWDKTGGISEANDAFLRTVGYSRDDLRAGRVRWSDMTPPEYRELDEQGLAELRSRGVTTPFEKEYVRKDGQRVPVMVGAALFEGSRDQGVAFVLDMSAHKRAEAALRDSEERFRNAFDHAPVGMFLTGLDGQWLKVNHALCQIVGYSEAELLATTWKAITHPDDIEADLANVHRLLTGQAAYYHMEKRYLHRDGHIIWIILGGSLVRDSQNRPLYFVGHVQDVTQRKRAEDEMRGYSERVQALSRRLMSAQEDERRHLARELHDEFGQVLATITLHLHVARRLAGEAAGPRLEDCAALLRQAGEQVRGLALNLRPTMLDTLGLESTLRSLAEQHRQRTGTETQVVGHLSGEPLPPDVTIACYRVAQEALTNVVRHAQAQHVRVELSQAEGALELAVHDDGVGFDVVSAQEQAARRGSLGLLGMAERVHLLDGALRVESEPGRGTCVRATFPLNEKTEEPAEPECV